jgi:hypothetical protein
MDVLVERLHKIADRFLELEQINKGDGRAEMALYLRSGLERGDRDRMLEIGRATSLIERHSLVKWIFIQAMMAALKCDECGTLGCSPHDPDLCAVIQIMGA